MSYRIRYALEVGDADTYTEMLTVDSERGSMTAGEALSMLDAAGLDIGRARLKINAAVAREKRMSRDSIASAIAGAEDRARAVDADTHEAMGRG